MHSAMPSVQCVRDCASLIAQLLPASRTGRAAHARAPCQPIWPMLYVLITRSKRQTLPTLQGCRLCFIDNDYREFYAECPEKQQKFPIKSSLFSQSIICYIFTTKKKQFLSQIINQSKARSQMSNFEKSILTTRYYKIAVNSTAEDRR